jgi:predicted DsbA family dithiol-disulfide isomerase
MNSSLYMALRFGSRDRARQAQAVVEDTAKRDGLPLDLKRITHTPNTLDAHRLLAFSAESETGIGTERTERLTGLLFAAYFVQGLDIGAQDTLLSLAEQAGLDPNRARLHLEADPERDLALFLANISSYQLDLHAVPCFIFDRRFVLAGAQETTAFLPLLDLALSDPSLDSA